MGSSPASGSYVMAMSSIHSLMLKEECALVVIEHIHHLLILCSYVWRLFYLSSFWYTRTTLLSLSSVPHPDKLNKERFVTQVTFSSTRLNMYYLCDSGRMSSTESIVEVICSYCCNQSGRRTCYGSESGWGYLLGRDVHAVR